MSKACTPSDVQSVNVTANIDTSHADDRNSEVPKISALKRSVRCEKKHRSKSKTPLSDKVVVDPS